MARSAEWQSPAAPPSFYATAPDIGTSFQRGRDPSFAAQLDDLKKSEAQRREESSGGGSSMVQDDKPAPALKPPPAMRAEQDRSNFNRAWAREQMDWAMRHRDRDHQQALMNGGRERAHLHGPQQTR